MGIKKEERCRGGRQRSVISQHYELQFEVDIVFLGQAAQVDDGVAHAAEGRVDADAGAVGDLLEVAFAVVAQNDHPALLGGQHLEQAAHILVGLFADDLLLDIFLVQVEGLHDVAVGTVGDYRHFALPTEIVDNQVVCNTHYPVYELVLVLVEPRVDSIDYLVEGVLEDVVGDILVLDDGKDIAVDLILIPREQGLKARIVSFAVA